MRPKRVILLLDENEDRRRIRRVIFETWGYRVLSGDHLPEKPGPVILDAHVAVIDHNGKTPSMVQAVRENCPEANIVTVGETGGDVWIPRNVCPDHAPSLLIETVRTMAVRRRGPKKGCIAAVPVVQSVVPLTDGMREAGRKR